MAGASSILIRGGIVVPMAERGAWARADVLVDDGTVAAVGDGLVPPPGTATLDADGALVLPGFVQTHVHVVQSLARHRAEGLQLLAWLKERVWPYEAALTAAETAAAARLGVAELLAGGTTTALDMGSTRHHDGVFTAAQELGIRLTSGKCLMDGGDGAPSELVEDTETALRSAEELGERWHGTAGGRLRYAVAPRFILSCTPRLLAGAADLARRHGWLLHTHAGENRHETALVRELTGLGNVAALAEHGISGPDTVLAHCVHVDDEEVALMASAGTTVAHCPGANLKLASGIADLPRLLGAGVRVGLGADGPPCNNRLSIFHEMALAGTLHNLEHGAGAVDPWEVLELATWRGARALGLPEPAGRIVPGAPADIVVLDGRAWAMEPLGDPAAAVVHGGGPEGVRHVLVDGVPLVVGHELAGADGAAIRRDARKASAAIAQRLGWT